MVAGRPKIELSELPEHWEEIIFNLAIQGASQTEVRAALALDSRKKGLSRDLYNRLLNEEEEFSAAIKNYFIFAKAWWEREGRENLENKEFQSALWFMNMRNRYGWTNNSKIEVDKEAADDNQSPAISRLAEVLERAITPRHDGDDKGTSES